MEIIIKDASETLSIIFPKDALQTIPYFEALLSFENSEDITLEVSNAKIMLDVILGQTTEDWFYQLKEDHLYQLEVIRCQDFLGLEPSIFPDLKIPPENFDLLLSISEITGYKDIILQLMNNNLPDDYDLALLPQNLIDKMIKNASTFRIVSYNSAYNVRMWDSQTGNIVKSWRNDPVWAIACSSDNRFIALGENNGNVLIINADTYELQMEIPCLHKYCINSIAFSPDDQFIITGSSDRLIKIWNLEKNILVHTLKGHASLVNIVVFSPDGHYIASGSLDNNVKIWYSQEGTLKYTLGDHTGGVYSLAYTSDSQCIASGSSDKSIKIWDANNGILVKTIEAHNDLVSGLVYSPDNLNLISAGWDNYIKVWDIKTGALINTLSGHTDSVYSIMYSPDKRFLVSDDDDYNIKIWDAKTGKLIKTLNNDSHIIMCTAVIGYDDDLVKKLKKYLHGSLE